MRLILGKMIINLSLIIQPDLERRIFYPNHSVAFFKTLK